MAGPLESEIPRERRYQRRLKFHPEKIAVAKVELWDTPITDDSRHVLNCNPCWKEVEPALQNSLMWRRDADFFRNIYLHPELFEEDIFSNQLGKNYRFSMRV